LGWFYTDKDGNKYLGSNAHVFTPNPFNPPEQVSPKDIVQPGTYDGGSSPNDLVGHYVWHTQIFPESSGKSNYMDFALATIEVDCDFKIWQKYILENKVGLLYAGSSQVTVVFKEKYAVQAGYSPLNAKVTEVNVGDYVEKWGRTSGHTIGKVLDTSATVKVYYGGDNYAIFVDQILTEAISSPGDSGSSVWLYVEQPPYDTQLSINAPLKVKVGENFTAWGELDFHYVDWKPLPNASIAFFIDDAKAQDLITGSDGKYVTKPFHIDKEGTHTLKVAYAGDANHKPSEASTTVDIVGYVPPPITAKFIQWTKQAVKIFGAKVAEISNERDYLPYVGQNIQYAGTVRKEDLLKNIDPKRVIDLSKLDIPKTRSGEPEYVALVYHSFSAAGYPDYIYLFGIGEGIVKDGVLLIRAVNTDYWTTILQSNALIILYEVIT
ncbi:MAG: hypothetical protein ACP5IT_11815, partial [Thermoproteota archaeon]